jgi:hypothetical protein
MVNKLIYGLPKRNDNEIFLQYKNCIIAISQNKPNKKDAEILIQAIKKEWSRRKLLYDQNKYKPTTPKDGMMGAFGYHVGNSGEPLKIRRIIIDDIMITDLPLIQSPAYTAEWGEPKSQKRFNKMKYFFQQMIFQNNKRNRDNAFDKAITEWEDDLNYLIENWKNKLI